MKQFWKWFGFALLAGALALVVMLALPVTGHPGVRGVETKNISNAKQLALGVRIYAQDFEGRFPVHLSELVPDYVSETLLFEVREDSNESAYAKADWLYFGGSFDETNPPPILIASPQVTGFKGKPPKRIMIHADGAGGSVSEEDYQAELRKTIEAMHKRFDAAKPAP